MKTLVLAAIRWSLLFLVPTLTYATNAEWDLDPISGDWNTADNWTPNGVPNGLADVATFGLSNTTEVSISANTEVNSIIFTAAATNPYSITVSSDPFMPFTPRFLTLSGTGITNNSGITQRFVIENPNGIGKTGMRFTNGASAGNVRIDMFGSATGVNFFNHSTAGNALLNFGDKANFVNFFDNSKAGSASLNLGPASGVFFRDRSSAGNGTILCDFQSQIEFSDSSTAANATIQANGADIFFRDSSNGGTAAIRLFEGSFGFRSRFIIDSVIAPGVTIGSLEGDETPIVFLGNNLTVGNNNLSTTFAGVIQGTGSLTKIGRGTFILSGANTYTGDTTVNRGVLQVDGSITSNTFVNHPGTLAGTGTINGNLTNNGRVIPGSAGSPGMLTVTGNYTQAQYATLMIQLAGANAGEFSVLNILGTANLSGQLKPLLLNGFLPTVGESFTFLQYGAVNGTLFMFNRNIDNLPEHWEVSYFPTFAVLTVVAGNVPVPDQGSTFVLLTLGLFGLVTFQRHCFRRFRTKRG